MWRGGQGGCSWPPDHLCFLWACHQSYSWMSKWEGKLVEKQHPAKLQSKVSSDRRSFKGTNQIRWFENPNLWLWKTDFNAIISEIASVTRWQRRLRLFNVAQLNAPSSLKYEPNNMSVTWNTLNIHIQVQINPAQKKNNVKHITAGMSAGLSGSDGCHERRNKTREDAKGVLCTKRKPQTVATWLDWQQIKNPVDRKFVQSPFQTFSATLLYRMDSSAKIQQMSEVRSRVCLFASRLAWETWWWKAVGWTRGLERPLLLALCTTPAPNRL